jgi:hypothetical protein
VKLGDIVKDIRSDFEGMAVGSLRTFSGFTQFLVQGKDKDGEPKAEWIDVVTLKVTEEADEDRSPKPLGNFDLGDRVVDIASDWEANVTAEVLYLNGCVRYEVQGKGKDGVPALVGVDEALLRKVEKAPPLPQPEQQRQGGSTSRASVRKDR